jgi:hypothetical protein
METKSKTSLGKKIEYALCLLGGTYFIGRFIIGIAFNI